MTEPAGSCPHGALELAVALAERARAIVMPHFRTGFEVTRKADRSPVTIADRETENALRDMIAAAFPGHGVVGEEFGADRPEAEHVWVLDPIDGTKRFVTGHPQFGTLIALLHGGRPVLGLIDMPALGERWLGAAGRATVMRDSRGEREVRTRPCRRVADASLYVNAPDTFAGDDLAALTRLRGAVALSVYDGDCYAYGLIASGCADLVFETDMAPYDFLALVPVVAGAGGCITDWRGGALGLESSGQVLAAGDPALHAAARDALARS